MRGNDGKVFLLNAYSMYPSLRALADKGMRKDMRAKQSR